MVFSWKSYLSRACSSASSLLAQFMGHQMDLLQPDCPHRIVPIQSVWKPISTGLRIFRQILCRLMMQVALCVDILISRVPEQCVWVMIRQAKILLLQMERAFISGIMIFRNRPTLIKDQVSLNLFSVIQSNWKEKLWSPDSSAFHQKWNWRLPKATIHRPDN